MRRRGTQSILLFGLTFGLTFGLACCATWAAAQDRVKIAEGGFHHIDHQGDMTIELNSDEWSLWRVGDHYEVEGVLKMLSRAGGGEVHTLLRLGPNFRITHVRLEPHNSRNGDGFYDCGAGRGRLECSYGGARTGQGSIAIPFPYVFDTSAQDPPMGIAWTYANLVGAAERVPGKVTEVPSLTVKAVTQAGRTTPAEETIDYKQIKFLGQDQIVVQGHRVTANRWEIAKDMAVWTSKDGMPLQLESLNGERKWTLRGFRQYGPLVAGLPVEEAATASAAVQTLPLPPSNSAAPGARATAPPTPQAAAKRAAQTAVALDRPPSANAVKVAEGAYGVMDSWVLWRVGDQFTVVIANGVFSAKDPGSQMETLEMDRALHMRRMRFESAGAGFLPDGALDCAVKALSLDCVSSFAGQEGRGTVRVAGAYATQFGAEIALLDMPWFFATLVAHAERERSQQNSAGVVALAFDGPKPDALVTANTYDGTIRYLGREPIQVLGKSVNSHKYRITVRHYDATVWAADSGLLLAFDWGGLKMALTRYREYESLAPELAGAAPH